MTNYTTAYSDFELEWLFTILTKDILKRDDLLGLLDKFGIHFYKENWREVLSREEFGNVLLDDIPKENLFPAVKKLVKKSYSQFPTFEECKKMYERLKGLDGPSLIDFYFNISKKQEIKDFIQKDKEGAQRLSKKDILDFLVEPMYKHPREKIKQKVDSLLSY